MKIPYFGNDHTNDVLFFCLTENATDKIILPKENIEKKLNKVLQRSKEKKKKKI